MHRHAYAARASLVLGSERLHRAKHGHIRGGDEESGIGRWVNWGDLMRVEEVNLEDADGETVMAVVEAFPIGDETAEAR